MKSGAVTTEARARDGSEKGGKAGVVVYALIPALGSLGQEDCKFGGSLGYVRRPYVRKQSSSIGEGGVF